MKYVTIICGICCVLVACSSSTDNSTAPVSADTPSYTPQDSLPFPQSWLGYWQGTLNIFKDNQIVQTVPMALEIQAIDSSENYTWAIIYGEDKIAGRRPYELEIIDAARGQYRIDEKNSIRLESYLHVNKLLCWYEVMGNQIMSTYEQQGDRIIFEIIFGKAEPVSITGDQEFEGAAIPAVKTFPIGGYQRAVLRKQ